MKPKPTVIEKGKDNDLMLFGKTKEELAKDVVSGKISVDTVMNEWMRRYTQDLYEN